MSTDIDWVPGKGHQTSGNTQSALYPSLLVLACVLGHPEEAERLLLQAGLGQWSPPPHPFEAHTAHVAASCQSLGPFPSFTEHASASYSFLLLSQLLLSFLILFCVSWSAFSHCKGTPWKVLHHELALLQSLIQASWSETSVSCPSKPACVPATGGIRAASRLSVGLPIAFPVLCVALMSLPIWFRYVRSLFQQLFT